MDMSLSSQQEIFTIASTEASPVLLLERGLGYLRQGRHLDGISLCELARAQIPPDQAYLAAAIDALLGVYERYRQAQHALHQASRELVEAENEQQTMLASIEQLLSDSSPEKPGISSAPPVGVPVSNGYKKSPTFLVIPGKSSGENSHQPPPSFQPAIVDQGNHDDHDPLPSLSITCFGRFEVSRFNQPVILCQNRNGQAILRYLITQPGFRATIDALMDTLWPNDEPEVARHKVQVAVSALRRSLNNGYASDPGGGYILCKNGVYQANPAITIYTDVDTFLFFYSCGQQSTGDEAIACYEKACSLYKGPFLAEDMYADWTFVRREQLSQKFLAMCHMLAEHHLTAGHYEEATQWAGTILAENRCDEKAHRLLMQAYIAQGHRSEALRQFRRCEHILYNELGTTPTPETVALFQSLLLSQNPAPTDHTNRAKIERK